eukprot:2146537-Amphidinium_carterae.1
MTRCETQRAKHLRATSKDSVKNSGQIPQFNMLSMIDPDLNDLTTTSAEKVAVVASSQHRNLYSQVKAVIMSDLKRRDSI